MSLIAGFSANNDLFDHIQRDIAEHCHAPLPAPYPEPWATHCWLERKTPDYYRGVEFVPPWSREFDPHEKDHQVVRRYLITCDEATEEVIWRAVQRNKHELYDMIGLAVIGYYCLTNQPDRFYTTHHATLFCSEAVTTWLRTGNIPVWPKLPADNVFPALLESYIVSSYPRFTVP